MRWQVVAHMEDGSTRIAEASTPTQLRELQNRGRANPDVIAVTHTQLPGASVPDPEACPRGHRYFLTEMIKHRACRCGLTHAAADCGADCGGLFYPPLEPGCGPADPAPPSGSSDAASSRG
ncbi:hypothetical protein R8Z50_22250 [Longispora sp. K20-0274]|uniref:hypothetical protein n=1 Tax=Longispora sp. K20-0274 TaxID=3088255 RepID=UPI00399BFEF4